MRYFAKGVRLFAKITGFFFSKSYVFICDSFAFNRKKIRIRTKMSAKGFLIYLMQGKSDTFTQGRLYIFVSLIFIKIMCMLLYNCHLCVRTYHQDSFHYFHSYWLQSEKNYYINSKFNERKWSVCILNASCVYSNPWYNDYIEKT